MQLRVINGSSLMFFWVCDIYRNSTAYCNQMTPDIPWFRRIVGPHLRKICLLDLKTKVLRSFESSLNIHQPSRSYPRRFESPYKLLHKGFLLSLLHQSEKSKREEWPGMWCNTVPVRYVQLESRSLKAKLQSNNHQYCSWYAKHKVRQTPGWNSQRRDTARTLPN